MERKEIQQKRPGGPLKGKPVEGLDERWYDPFGKPIKFEERDLIYAKRFWSHNQPRGLREVMIENVLDSEKHGFLGCFVSSEGIDETNKEKLSAYRVLAQQMGYKLGKFIFNRPSFVAMAHITKSEYLI